ncbi:MAG: hypothetical protein KGL63_01725 [Betaproteobacteria bacterium]|nr:hypothetical protein [Betaproteobacteria bacterium]
MTEAPFQTHFAGQNGAAVAGAPEDPPFTVLPIDMRGRRWSLRTISTAVDPRVNGKGEVEDVYLTIAVKREEMESLERALMWQAKEG